MSGLYTVKTIKSFGARSDRHTWSNTYHFGTDVDIASPEMRAIGNQVVEAERLAHTSDVQFMRFVIAPKADNLLNRPANQFVSIGVAGTGTHPANQANPTMPLEVCVEVLRTPATGRSGRCFYRGCFTRDDLVVNGTGAFIATQFAHITRPGFPGNLVDALNTTFAQNLEVLPIPAGLVLQQGRMVVSRSMGAVIVSKLTRNRKSADKALVDAVKRELRGLEHRALKLLGGLASPTLLTGAAAATFNVLSVAAMRALESVPPAAIGLLELPAVFL